MKRKEILIFVVLGTVFGSVVYFGANIDEIIDLKEDETIVSEKELERYNDKCRYWFSHYELLKTQRDWNDPQSVSYLKFELDMEKTMDKIKSSCYGD